MEQEHTIPNYASFWSRLLAFIIDYMLVVLVLSFLITLVVVFGFADIGPLMVEQNDDLVRNLTESWAPAPYVLFISFWLYDAIMHSSAWGATVGKRMLGLYVADENGHRISFWQATLRFLGKFISFFTLFVGFLVALIHPKNQTLYDLLARTYVQRW